MEAVTHTGSPLKVQAGPGTGKTRVLVSRILYLLESGRASTDRILAITFTNQAAGEIGKRLSESPFLDSYKKSDSSRISVAYTFHGWAKKFIDAYSGHSTRAVIDEKESAEIVALCIKASGQKGLNRLKIQKKISSIKQYWPVEIDGEVEEFKEVWLAYHDFLAKHGLMDYDDLILEANRLLMDEEIKKRFQLEKPFILVDEFQDVSPAQYALVKSMSPKDGDITVIGDRFQSIYGFRGSDPRFMEEFDKDFSNTKEIALDQGYRCPAAYMEAAGKVVKSMDAWRLNSLKNANEQIVVTSFGNVKSEASWIVDKIEDMTGGLSFDSINSGIADGSGSTSLAEIAVLYRSRSVGEPLALEMERRGIPFSGIRESSPLESGKIRSVMRLWEMVKGSRSEYHLKMLEKELKISNESLKMFVLASRDLDNMTLLSQIAKFIEVPPSDPDLQAIAAAVEANPMENSFPLLLHKEADALDIQVESVSLMSMHAAKGLEFQVVFLAGCENGILPWDGVSEDEERRLFYVALTRASRDLFITWSGKRFFYGRKRTHKATPFLKDIPENLKKNIERKPLVRHKKPKQLKLF